MAVTVIEHELKCNCPHKQYDVVLDDGTEIFTIVTRDPTLVSSWIEDTEEALNESRSGQLIVGLDVEWRPNFNPNTAVQNPVATLQLCVGKFCLIYQILHSPEIPLRLRNFLRNDNYRFVGVGIDADVAKLWNDYGLVVSNTVDLREWAAVVLGKKNVRNFGLKNLVKEILGKEIEKPKGVTVSAWDKRWLSYKQIGYACVDAFLSFKVGKRLSVKAQNSSRKAAPPILCVSAFAVPSDTNQY